MSPYIAIAKRDLRQGKWAYLYFLMISMIVPLTLFLSGSDSTEKLVLDGAIQISADSAVWILCTALLPFFILGIQYRAMKSMYTHVLAYMLPHMRKFQYFYSLSIYVLASLMVVLIWERDIVHIMFYLAVFILIGSMTVMSLSPNYKGFGHLLSSLFFVFILLIIFTNFGSLLLLTLQQFQALSKATQLLFSGLLMGISFMLFVIAYRLYMKPQEINEEQLALNWAHKANRNVLVGINAGRSRKRRFNKNISRFNVWQERLNLINKNDALEIALFSGEHSATGSFGILFSGMMMMLLVIMDKVLGYSEISNYSIIHNFFFIVAWYLTVIFLTFELMSNKSLIGQLPLWYKGTRLGFMQQVAKIQLRRVVRLYAALTLIFSVAALVLAPSTDGIQTTAIISLYNLTFIPFIVGYILFALASHKRHYSIGFRYTTIFVFLLAFGLSSIIILPSPIHFLWLFALGFLVFWGGYKKWCNYELEAIA
jgi:hypothetical protein